MVRRRRNLRKPSAPKPQAAPASPADTVMEVTVDRVELARPTRTAPVLVTGPSPAVTASAAEEAGAAVATGEAAAAEEVGLVEPLPTPSPPLVMEGAAYALGLAGAVVGVKDSVAVRGAETVMVTDELPGPQAALTVYDPEADCEIVADPVKLICVFAIDAEPPTKADE
jgi:hypothetical protein